MLHHWCRRRGKGVHVEAHHQKFWFGENPGKIPENLGKIAENLHKTPENISKNGA